jgi:hypothetical protein
MQRGGVVISEIEAPVFGLRVRAVVSRLTAQEMRESLASWL